MQLATEHSLIVHDSGALRVFCGSGEAAPTATSLRLAHHRLAAASGDVPVKATRGPGAHAVAASVAGLPTWRRTPQR
jgi:hypothetical protein